MSNVLTSGNVVSEEELEQRYDEHERHFKLALSLARETESLEQQSVIKSYVEMLPPKLL